MRVSTNRRHARGRCSLRSMSADLRLPHSGTYAIQLIYALRKSVKKAVNRMPHNVRAATGFADTTRDSDLDDLNKRFQLTVKEAEKLHRDAKKFCEAVKEVLKHQARFADYLLDIYKPITGSEAGPQARRAPTNAQAMNTCEDFANEMNALKDNMNSQLDLIERNVIQPTADLLSTMKLINKTISKRDHKRQDYDRHRQSYKKLKDKKDKSFSDEKQMAKLEEELEQSTELFNRYNDMIKDDLPVFFEDLGQFIGPVFESFYTLQMRTYQYYFEMVERVATSGHFDLDSDIIRGFNEKHGDVKQQVEALMVLGGKLAHNPDRIVTRAATGDSARSRSYTARRSNSEYDDAPPPYNAVIDDRTSSKYASSNPKLFPAAGTKPPPPRPPLAAKPKIEAAFVIALYDYDAQADGDLTFRKDDRIQVVERTANTDDWWKGRLRGQVGTFPANYVREA